MREDHQLGRRTLIRGAMRGGAAMLASTAPARRAAAQATPAAATGATPAVTPAALPNSPVGQQMAWVVGRLDDGLAGISGKELQGRFAPGFLAAVPPLQLVAVLRGLAAGAPYAVEGYQEPVAGTQAVAILVGRDGLRWRTTIAVEPAPPHRIAGLLFQPEAAAPLTSWEAFDRAWGPQAPRASFLAAEVVDGALRPVRALSAGDRLAIGSTFKLYVLGALARQIAAGAASWDEPLAIRDDWKSLPSGDMRLLPAGTTRTLRQFAEQMISVSDNTAADHLLFRLGRETVEAAQGALGHGDPARNVPFLSTREAFAFKLALPAARTAAYLAAPVPEKRRILATEVDRSSLDVVSIIGWTAPRLIEEIEWFASAEDLCRAMAALDALSRRPGLEPVGEILAISPGIAFDAQTWPSVRFKGGSEVGVLNLTWRLARSDGRVFALAATLNDPAARLDEARAVALLPSAVTLLGRAS